MGGPGVGVFARCRYPLRSLPSTTAREGRPVALDLAEVVHQAVEQPLPVDLGFASKREAIESFGMADVGKRGLGGGEPSLIYLFAEGGVDLAFHFGGEFLACTGAAPAEEHHLAHARRLGVT